MEQKIGTTRYIFRTVVTEKNFWQSEVANFSQRSLSRQPLVINNSEEVSVDGLCSAVYTLKNTSPRIKRYVPGARG